MTNNERPGLEGAKGAVGDQRQDHSIAPAGSVKAPFAPSADRKSDAAEFPEGTGPLTAALAALTTMLPEVTDALKRRPENKPAVERMALRIDEVAAAIGISRRAIERERSAGRFPAPDLTVGKMPLWKPQTIQAWLEKGGHQ